MSTEIQIDEAALVKKNPTALFSEADGSAIAILNYNKAAAYLVPCYRQGYPTSK